VDAATAGDGRSLLGLEPRTWSAYRSCLIWSDPVDAGAVVIAVRAALAVKRSAPTTPRFRWKCPGRAGVSVKAGSTSALQSPLAGTRGS